MRSYILTDKERDLAQQYINGEKVSEVEMANLRVLVSRIKHNNPRIKSDIKLGIKLIIKYYEENGE